jgi:hypothetical protein
MTALLTNLLTIYGYWLIFALVGIESIGLPLPGESMLLVAAVYAGSTHRLSIALVIVLAITGTDMIVLGLLHETRLELGSVSVLFDPELRRPQTRRGL